MNKKIVIAAFVITGSGVIRAASKHEAITPVIMGAYIFILMLSIMDIFGGPVSDLAGALALVAVVGILLNQFPWSLLISILTTKQVRGPQGQHGTSGNF